MLDTKATTTAHTLWLTYTELADRLGITGDSARNLVRRRQWVRKPGNDGSMRIGVPKEYLDERDMEEALPSPTEPPIDPPIVATIIPPIEVDTEGATVAALEAHIETLKEIVDRERGRGDIERDRADAERARAEAERARADELAAKIEQLRHDAVTAGMQGAAHVAKVEADIAELRALVDTMKAGPGPRPWWKRLVG
ncbi:hypothetical protein [Lichenibacterium ramalinae]|uniref:Uncharacterized protein n=1 Tax=Lichenibacterium ramalinae TaxID=2316527 RepID=A0A4Q2R7C5_9HYPH|nr:hypothetical protein [Lichenibacterium ramalinae]RYB01384.1 hypothetical protein D3272_26425 [Lichenibacterium ramalinae]